MGSTYEDDCEEGDEIILCDGCNTEAHIRCLSMTSVPSTEWHCAVCTERIAAREARAGHGYLLKDVDRCPTPPFTFIVSSFLLPISSSESVSQSPHFFTLIFNLLCPFLFPFPLSIVSILIFPVISHAIF
jgi:PHD-finger